MISATDPTFGYGPEPVLQQVGLIAEHGAVLGLVGPNGSGKTTLLRLLYAELAPEAGEAAEPAVGEVSILALVRSLGVATVLSSSTTSTSPPATATG
jgi:iron complex transport system ATP-binding protein